VLSSVLADQTSGIVTKPEGIWALGSGTRGVSAKLLPAIGQEHHMNSCVSFPLGGVKEQPARRYIVLKLACSAVLCERANYFNLALSTSGGLNVMSQSHRGRLLWSRATRVHEMFTVDTLFTFMI